MHVLRECIGNGIYAAHARTFIRHLPFPPVLFVFTLAASSQSADSNEGSVNGSQEISSQETLSRQQMRTVPEQVAKSCLESSSVGAARNEVAVGAKSSADIVMARAEIVGAENVIVDDNDDDLDVSVFNQKSGDLTTM